MKAALADSVPAVLRPSATVGELGRVPGIEPDIGHAGHRLPRGWAA
jgi:hypothetical protein